MDFDVIIVGGSFAGLSCAYHLAKKGLNVCLFEKNKIGLFTKSTGILTQSAVKDANIPKELIENEIKGFYLFSPSMKKLKLQFIKTRLCQSNTLELLKWLKELAVESNVKIIESKNCKNIDINQRIVDCENHHSKVIIFATGLSGLNVKNVYQEKQPLYAGLEYIANTNFHIEDIHYWHLFFDVEISPGYISWIAPIDDKKIHIGVLRKMDDKISLKTDMDVLLKKLKIKIKKIYERRTGLATLSGPIKKTYGYRHILVGDAAGQCGALFSNGIDYSIRVGKIVGGVLPNLIDDPIEKNLKSYEVEWKKEFGKQLEEQLILRKIYERISSNDKIERFFDIVSKISNENLDKVFYNLSNMEEINLQSIMPAEFYKIIKSFL